VGVPSTRQRPSRSWLIHLWVTPEHFVDVCATVSELGIAVAPGAVLLCNAPPKRRCRILLIGAVVVVSVGHVVHLA
jgi:hypothetical protein